MVNAVVWGITRLMRALWLICEDKSGAEVIIHILKRRYPDLSIQYRLPAGDYPNISQLARQLSRLIEGVLADQKYKSGDCIAVLHDLDIHRQPNRADHETIKSVYEAQLTAGVKILHFIAADEIESWLLSDSGVCRWLKKRPRNHDEKAAPKDILNGWLDDEHKKRYSSVRGREEVLKHVSGDGDTHSPSMRQAMQQLIAGKCID